MSETTAITADDFDFIWNAADRIRDRLATLHEISDAMTTLGLHEVAIKISAILAEIEDDTTEIQSALVDGIEGEEPPFGLDKSDAKSLKSNPNKEA